MAKRKNRAGIRACSECGGALRRRTVTYEFKVGRAAFSGEVRALVCPKCGEELTDGASMAKLELDAAVFLTRYRPSADAIRFFRGVLNLRAKVFADLVGVAPETVSRWENGVHDIDRAAWAHLCSMVLDEAVGTATTLERLRANALVREREVGSRKPVLKSA